MCGIEAVAIKFIFSWIISFLVTFRLVPLFCSLAMRLRFVDVPDGTIKQHKNPTPYLGGVVVYVGFITALAIVFPFHNQFFFLIVGATLLLMVGLIDDLLILRPYQKLFGQIIATFCFLKAGFYVKAQFFHSNWNILISFFWILTIINAFNLVDVMDGLASLLAIMISCVLFCISIYLGHWHVALLLSTLVGALCAFLWYNKPVARIYLGDSGSLFIGGVLSVTPFLIEWSRYNWYGYLTPLIIFGIPLLELVLLITIRAYKRIPFYLGSPDHFCMYLQKNRGWGKQTVLWYICSLSLVQLLISLLFVASIIPLSVLIFIAIVFHIVWFFMLFAPKTIRIV